jgi:MFS superfamily sulfate permease-like transporter
VVVISFPFDRRGGDIMFALFSVELVSGIVKGIGIFIGATAIPFVLKYLYNKAKTALRNGNDKDGSRK